MEQHVVLAHVTDIVRDFLDDDDLVLSLETVAADVEAWDSLSHINILIAIEQHFGIRFLTAELERFDSVGQLVDAIRRKIP